MLALYFAPGSSSMAVHIALHEVEADFEAHPLSFRRREHRSAAYLELNQEGKVPTLVVDGRPLTEVAAILFYLARRFPEHRLLSEGAEQEAQALSWMSFAASTLHPARRKGIEHAEKVYGIAEKRMDGQAWVVGSYSVADIHLFRLYWRLRRSLGNTPGRFPTLDAHYERMLTRPAVKRTLEIEAAIGYELPD